MFDILQAKLEFQRFLLSFCVAKSAYQNSILDDDILLFGETDAPKQLCMLYLVIKKQTWISAWGSRGPQQHGEWSY